MILDTTTKSVELILGAAVTTNAMPVTVDYVDLTTTTTLAGSSDTQSNGTTEVTILAAPAASTQRKLNALTVFNADTASKVVTIRLNNNTTMRNLISVTLQVGCTIGYTDTGGWYLMDSDGNLKSVQAASATSIATAIHGATDKTTPVAADEVGIWDSVSGLLNRVSFTNLLNWFAAKLGNSSNVFSGAAATDAAHFVRRDQTNVGGDAFSAYLPTADQSLSSGVATKVTLSAENFDLNSTFDSATNYRFTPTIAGYYQMSWAVLGGGNAATIAVCYGALYKNGALYKSGSYYGGAGINNFNSTGSVLVYMNGSTDYLELFGWVTATNPKFLFDSTQTYMAGVLVRR